MNHLGRGFQSVNPRHKQTRPHLLPSPSSLVSLPPFLHPLPITLPPSLLCLLSFVPFSRPSSLFLPFLPSLFPPLSLYFLPSSTPSLSFCSFITHLFLSCLFFVHGIRFVFPPSSCNFFFSFPFSQLSRHRILCFRFLALSFFPPSQHSVFLLRKY